MNVIFVHDVLLGCPSWLIFPILAVRQLFSFHIKSIDGISLKNKYI